MMTMQRRQHSAAFKAKVALEAIRGERTINERAAEYGVHPVHITQGKKVVLEEVPTLFSSHRGAKSKEEDALKAALYQQSGPLKVELDWLKKTTVVKLPPEAPRAVPTKQETLPNHGERASTYSSCPFGAAD
jgi:transposase-like protein